jgi:hypothetical protein
MHSINILFQAAFFGGLPRFRLAGVSDVAPSPTSSWGEAGLGFGGLPLLRFVAGSPAAISSGALLGCVNHGGSERAMYGVSSAEHTLGGLPLFLFSPAAGAASDGDAAVPAAFFLFLLPLGRPRPRFAGVGAMPEGGTRRLLSTRNMRGRALSIVAKEERKEKERGTDRLPSYPLVEHRLRARREVCDRHRGRRLESQT